MKHLIIGFLFFIGFVSSLAAQDAKTAWDNTIDKKWPEGFVPVKIKSSLDGKMQKAVFYKSPKEKLQPLIVSLHTWSGDYTQEDPLAEEVKLRGWNYIHPDFRGPNNNPEACGSEQVISDIEDAIRYAVKNGAVDTSEIHIIGVSGGGYATLLSFMKLNYPVKSFSAWAPVTNLEDWYRECTGRKLKYARDLEGVTTGGKGFDVIEARKRSPGLMIYPRDKRKNATLYIYTGVHDGYTGSVPITQSINMFNHLAQQMYPDDSSEIVSDSLKLLLVKDRMNPAPDTNMVIGGRKVHLFRELPSMDLTVFEGTHEMIVPQALALIPVGDKRNTKKLNILTIGDSNGAAKNGWPTQLKKLLPFSTIINQSIPGNTIGFDNLNNKKLNTLRNIYSDIDSAYKELPEGEELDYIIFGLGTNDAKKVFSNRQKEVSQNLDSLLNMTKNYLKANNHKMPKILWVSPPPMNEKIALKEKYEGGNKRIDKNIPRFKKIFKKQGVTFIDINTPFKSCTEELTVDGVHLTSPAQFKVAETIEKNL